MEKLSCYTFYSYLVLMSAAMATSVAGRKYLSLKTASFAVFLVTFFMYLNATIHPLILTQCKDNGKANIHPTRTAEHDNIKLESVDRKPKQFGIWKQHQNLTNRQHANAYKRWESGTTPPPLSRSSIPETKKPPFFESKQDISDSHHQSNSSVTLSHRGHPTKSSRNSSEERVNCKLLFQGNHKEQKKAMGILARQPYKFPADRLFINLTKNCETFRNSMGYHQKTLSQEEKEYPIAFAIRMHQIVAQAERLLRAIYMPQNVYCIYIDKKAREEVHKSMSSIASCFDNVFIASHLENFYYKGFSPVQADMQCMKDLLNTPVKWKYFINMPGSEFPLRTNLEMVRILKLLNGTNDIEQYPFPKEFEHRLNKKNKEPFKPHIDLQKGCSYNLFSREFVQWVLRDDLAQRFINWTKDTSDPDETVWGTLNHLPQAPGGYQDMVTQIAKTFLAKEVIWRQDNSYCWGQHFVHEICIISTRGLHDLGDLWHFFANKFNAEYDHIALDCLEERHRNRTIHPDPEHSVNWDVISRTPQMNATRRRHSVA